ncbi:3-oxoacyl-[acyl-carrier-protein] reductase FabG [Arthrobacter saudimassiliensis]|uniref:3-oxoacyl-[acyl-carrier-protein] reductase FabG n=1 Tax=Arthrobacter saudimassiliensis TaxID=1461584 RepID=A0A078MHR5_9MICC|nr:3-oxoacyl-[acyl-carrier-protein] reductase FabG [Arthrobacter saudimassiliensis]
MTVTLITGANKGIGFETARQLLAQGHTVYIGARDPERGAKAAAELGGFFVQLDVTDDASVAAALETIGRAEGALDVLVNNAGVMANGTVDGPTALWSFDTNAVGIVRVTEAALPWLQRSSQPVVVNVTSSMGSFWAVTTPERPESGLTTAPLYAASKAAANMLTLQYAKAHPDIRFNAVEPGFTATDMTAEMDGGRPVEVSAGTIVRLATQGAAGTAGTFSDEGGPLPW